MTDGHIRITYGVTTPQKNHLNQIEGIMAKFFPHILKPELQSFMLFKTHIDEHVVNHFYFITYTHTEITMYIFPGRKKG